MRGAGGNSVSKIRSGILLALLIFVMTAAPAFASDYRTTIDGFTYGNYEIPAYDGKPSAEVNQNLPAFSAEDLYAAPYASYGDLDQLGRSTGAWALLDQSLMPTGKRGDIWAVYPTGWIQQVYDIVPGSYLYNRCHLIGWQLTGTDMNTMPVEELAKNLITGTRYLNVGTGRTGMLEYEDQVAWYLREDADNQVAYRVTPVFGDGNLLAYGVLMEGQSVSSSDVEFCVFCYNVQPGIAIDYETGDSVPVVSRTRWKIKKLSRGKGRVKVTAKAGRVSGYQFAWRTGGKWKTRTGPGNIRLVKGLKSGKTCQFKVRSFQEIDGARQYSRWSPVRKVRVR